MLFNHGFNTDGKKFTDPVEFEGMDKFEADTDLLHKHFNECRVLKTDAEIEVMRYTNKISSDAHKEVMRQAKAGMCEFQLERWERRASKPDPPTIGPVAAAEAM